MRAACERPVGSECRYASSALRLRSQSGMPAFRADEASTADTITFRKTREKMVNF